MSKHKLTSEERAALKAEVDQINAEAAENWDDPAWRRLMKAQITESLTEGFEHESLLDLMTQVERVGIDERILVKETKGLKAHWLARGGVIETSSLSKDIWEMERDTLGFGVNEFEQKLRTSFAETQSTLIDLGAARMSSEVNLRFLSTFQEAIAPSSDYYIAGAGLSLSALDTALDEVFDETLDGEVVIVGRRTMVGQIANELTSGGYTAYLPETNEELRRTGILGEYKGAKILQLKNFKDDNNVSFFPANELFVLGRDASKAGFWGGLESQEWTDSEWYWNYRAKQDFGCIVHHPERARRVVDTSKAP